MMEITTDKARVVRAGVSMTGTRFTLDVQDTSRNDRNYIPTDLTFEQAHALADWIIANVPKPEPTPLPTKRAAVVKSGVAVFTLGDSEEPRWLELDSNGDLWLPSDALAERGFEVIFEGVDD